MKPLTGYRILIAEDERAVRMLLRVVLEAAGATVLEAENGNRAVRLLELEAGRVDLVITDLNMPGLDGVGLVAAVREQWGSELPIVMCSALDVASRVPGIDRQLQGIVSKPFAPPELVQVAARAITAGRATAALRRAAV